MVHIPYIPLLTPAFDLFRNRASLLRLVLLFPLKPAPPRHRGGEGKRKKRAGTSTSSGYVLIAQRGRRTPIALVAAQQRSALHWRSSKRGFCEMTRTAGWALGKCIQVCAVYLHSPACASQTLFSTRFGLTTMVVALFELLYLSYHGAISVSSQHAHWLPSSPLTLTAAGRTTS